MIERSPDEYNPFNPDHNPAVEYLPYDQDPGLLAVTEDGTKTGRELHHKLVAWRMATGIAESHTDRPDAQRVALEAEISINDFLAQAGLPRGVRMKSPPIEGQG